LGETYLFILLTVTRFQVTGFHSLGKNYSREVNPHKLSTILAKTTLLHVILLTRYPTSNWSLSKRLLKTAKEFKAIFQKINGSKNLWFLSCNLTIRTESTE
jgi:hypothetical protein